MPNGISCAFFAAKNGITGAKHQNIFQEGIACAQTTRTVNEAVQSAKVINPAAKNIFGKAASFARKILYPIIILSGVYNTVKSDDKVKTGISQASSIGTMYAFETIAEKGLKSLNSKILSSAAVKNNKATRIGWYTLKGLGFVTASLLGYNTGKKVSSDLVDKIREHKTDNVKQTDSGDVFDEITKESQVS
ncbi:MAG: hypothetical protein LUG16_01240 [Candidatus Gastranaerophilales bacterium]|nr:hypothetical protein [Candidatus Gastranaerophilales bacterium]